MQFFGDKYGDCGARRADRRQAGGAGRLLDGALRRHARPRHGRDRPVPHRGRIRDCRRHPAHRGRLRAWKPTSARTRSCISSRPLAGKVNSPVGELEKKIESLLAQQKDLEKQLKAMQQKAGGRDRARPGRQGPDLRRDAAPSWRTSARPMAISCNPLPTR